ncbi:MAG: glycosyltransferase family 2 protein [Negativicutes bacterium]|jgi:glycosyltransferase involved in cell wall biosynthesis
MNRLAVLILTYNEQTNIEQCILSARFADEIIVVDSFSNDETVRIAEQMGAKVFQNSFEQGFAAQRNFALTCTDCEWVFYLDADERVTPELALSIKAATIGLQNNSFEVLRQNYVMGMKLGYGVFKPDWSHRLYPQGSVTWEGIVHEHPVVNLPRRKLNGLLLHFTYQNWDKYFITFNRYTTMMAQKNIADGKKAGFADLALRAPFSFFQAYILRQGFRDGKIGFIMAVLHGFYTFAKYLKMIFLQRELV